MVFRYGFTNWRKSIRIKFILFNIYNVYVYIWKEKNSTYLQHKSNPYNLICSSKIVLTWKIKENYKYISDIRGLGHILHIFCEHFNFSNPIMTTDPVDQAKPYPVADNSPGHIC